jgi:hypothetical protein
VTTSERPRLTIVAIISGVMVVLGLFVLGRLLVRPDQPLTGTRVLDMAFGLFFVARGAIHFWTIRRRARG